MTGLTVVRAIHFAAAIQVVGALLFVWIVGRAPRSALRATESSERRRLMHAAILSIAVVVASGAAWFMLQAAEMVDSSVADAWTSGAIDTVLFKTRAGIIWWIRFAIATALAIAIVALARARGAPTQAAIVAGFALAVANLISCAWLSHAGADPSRFGSLHLGVHAVHMLGASLWLGGLVPLAMLLSRALRIGDDGDVLLVHHVGIWFGNIALLAVGLIVFTGIANTTLLVQSASDLTRGAFANLLAAKLILFLLMLVLAANNRQWLVPQLAGAKSLKVVVWLRRSVLAELALGALVLLVVGALGITPPGAENE
jgi:putative copper resistance protein D